MRMRKLILMHNICDAILAVSIAFSSHTSVLINAVFASHFVKFKVLTVCTPYVKVLVSFGVQNIYNIYYKSKNNPAVLEKNHSGPQWKFHHCSWSFETERLLRHFLNRTDIPLGHFVSGQTWPSKACVCCVFVCETVGICWPLKFE